MAELHNLFSCVCRGQFFDGLDPNSPEISWVFRYSLIAGKLSFIFWTSARYSSSGTASRSVGHCISSKGTIALSNCFIAGGGRIRRVVSISRSFLVFIVVMFSDGILSFLS